MMAQGSNLVGADSAVSHDTCGLVNAPIALTYTHIANLFHQYREELTRRLIGIVKSRETAADLVQDAYVRLLRLSDQHLVEQPRALLHKIATNLAIDHLRKEKHSIQGIDCLDAAMAVPCHAPSPERELLGKQRFRIFLQAIEHLPSRTREAFLLCRVYGFSYQEIAARMNISESGVEKLLMRALDRSCRALEAIDNAE
jgi:RNA polymerase sigma-70 factor (ECF subfamily)